MAEEGTIEEHPSRAERRGSPDRVVAFTDGVFAIVITILVLEVGIPDDLGDQSLREAIDDVGPTLVAWVISFLITGMYWVWHRDLFSLIRRVNRDVVWLNLMFLLPVCLIPFASSVLGEYHDEAIALHVYGVVMIAVSLFRIALFAYAMHHPHLLWEQSTDKDRKIGYLVTAAPIAVYVVAMLVADFSPNLSLVLFFSMPLLYFGLISFLRVRPGTSEEAQDFS